MIYTVKLIKNPRFKTIRESYADIMWSDTKYVAVKFYQCASKRYEYCTYALRRGQDPSSMYIAVEYEEISNENIISAIAKPENKLKIYSSNDGCVDAVLSAKMYMQLMSGRSLFVDTKSSILHNTSKTAYVIATFLNRFSKSRAKAIKNTLLQVIAISMTDCDIDYIRYATLDPLSWIHHYLI